MNIRVEEKETKTMVYLSGIIDRLSSVQMQNFINDLFKKGSKNLCLDFSEISFIGSTGIKTLLTLNKTITSQGGQFRIIAEGSDIEKIFSTIKLDVLLRI